ncbi:uncharacterized protein LOC117315441 [Pecten maximus]|uniref:uncharacterized protein LOC117315441 n=1 Tax=Pecten maximus TaxID=6579 RepID=UPI001458E283|nr:uncharacterized protein LOC117315441 [Pecten maximus]
MDDMIQLFVSSGSDKKTTFKIHKDASIEDLLKKICEWNGIEAATQRVIFAGKELAMRKNGKKMYVSDYKLQDRSTLFVVIRLPGGNDPDPPLKPKQLDEDVERTDLPDMITWDDDPANPRAKTPCGHAIGPESLTAYCRSLMSAGQWQFHCPYTDRKNSTECGQIWEYSIVKRLAVLTDDEKKYFETKLAQNYMRKSAGIQKCPKCTVFCMRQNCNDRRVLCLSCSKNGKRYESFVGTASMIGNHLAPVAVETPHVPVKILGLRS